MKHSALLVLIPFSLLFAASGCGPSLECNVGERICEGSLSRTCVYGEWVDVPCEGASPVCDVKHGCIKAESVCGNGAIDLGESCDRDNLANRTCADIIKGATGTLRCLETCQYDTSECRAPEKVCNDDDKRCNGNELQKCSANAWITSMDCTAIHYICDDASLSCIPGCQGEPRCSDDGQNAISCKDGKEIIEPCKDCHLDNQTPVCNNPEN